MSNLPNPKIKKHAYNFKGNLVKCEHCGKLFYRSPANMKGHVYCSKECLLKSSKVQLTCPVCKKVYLRKKSRCRHERVFCSKLCSSKWHTNTNNPIYRRETRICPICSSSFVVKPSERKKYCSPVCAAKAVSIVRFAENNPNWKPKVKRICALCGKTYLEYPSLDSRFCSYECYLFWLKNIKKISDADRAKMLQACLKRPTKPEKLLMDIIAQHRLPFKYVGNGSLIIGGLNPDFIRTDAHKQIIEVFGDYWHSDKVARGAMREDVRVAIFRHLGYQALIVWEKELKADPVKVANRATAYARCAGEA